MQEDFPFNFEKQTRKYFNVVGQPNVRKNVETKTEKCKGLKTDGISGIEHSPDRFFFWIESVVGYGTKSSEMQELLRRGDIVEFYDRVLYT